MFPQDYQHSLNNRSSTQLSECCGGPCTVSPPPILTALLMRNFTEKSSKTINRALTCTNLIFPQENILPNCCKGSKQTENLLYWNPELRITGILSIFIQSSQNHLKYYVFSSSIQQANLAKQVSDSIHSALNIQVTRLHFPPSTRQQQNSFSTYHCSDY